MKELNFSTGLVTYDLNGLVQVSFNPTDSSFIERLFDAFQALDEKQDEYKEASGSGKDLKAFFDAARKLDSEMRAMIDAVFGQAVCEPLFGAMNVYAMADGLPVWCNLIFSIMDEVDENISREQQQMNPALQKRLAKYKRQ